MQKRSGLLCQELKKRGYRLTSARQVIMDVLVQTGGHISADDLVEKVRARSPGVGRMTVYRTLDLLSELGLIRPVYQGTGAAHYIFMHDGHHHHLICIDCGLMVEVEECVLEEISPLVSGRYGFDLQGHLLEFYGLCTECRKRSIATGEQA